MKVVYSFLTLALIVTGYFSLKRDWELTKANVVKDLANREIELLKDEVNTYRMELISKPSFEEGYRQAILNQEHGTYARGFADAKEIFDKDNNYATGYHAAIEQFGLQNRIVQEENHEDK